MMHVDYWKFPHGTDHYTKHIVGFLRSRLAKRRDECNKKYKALYLDKYVRYIPVHIHYIL